MLKNILKISLLFLLLSGCFNKTFYIYPELNNKEFVLKRDLYILMYKNNFKEKYVISDTIDNYAKYIGVLNQGTKVKIINVKNIKTFESSYINYYLEILNEEKYKQKEFELFRSDYKYLEEVK